MQSDDCVQRKTRQVSRPEWNYKRSLVSLVAQVSNQRQRRGGSSVGWCDIKLPTRLQTWRTTMTDCPTRVWKRADWLTGLSPRGKLNSGIAASSWLQSDLSAHGFIVVKEITHTHTHTHNKVRLCHNFLKSFQSVLMMMSLWFNMHLWFTHEYVFFHCTYLWFV